MEAGVHRTGCTASLSPVPLCQIGTHPMLCGQHVVGEKRWEVRVEMVVVRTSVPAGRNGRMPHATSWFAFIVLFQGLTLATPSLRSPPWDIRSIESLRKRRALAPRCSMDDVSACAAPQPFRANTLAMRRRKVKCHATCMRSPRYDRCSISCQFLQYFLRGDS